MDTSIFGSSKSPGTGLGQIKSTRLFSCLLYTLLCFEVFYLTVTVVSEIGCGIVALGDLSSNPWPGVMPAITHVLISLGSFVISRWNIGLLVSVFLITVVHGSQATVEKRVPSKRYQFVTQFIDIHESFNILLMGVASAVYVQCIVNLTFWRFFVSYGCDQINDVSPKYIDVVCVNEKNLFIMVFVMMLNASEYVIWKMSSMYVLKFYHHQKNMSDHMFYFFRQNWMLPMRRLLSMFPVLLIFYKIIIQPLIPYSAYIGPEFALLEGTMTHWMELMDLEFIIKTVICSYISLSIFYGQWISVNLFLVEKPNSKINLMVPDGSAATNLNYISSNDLYVQTLGWFDLICGTKNRRSKLLSLFVLSHPGNRPYIWNGTLDQCIRIGNEMVDICNKFMAARSERPEVQANGPQVDSIIAHAGGLTMYQFDAPNHNDAPSNVRQRMIGRDLSANMPSQGPTITQPSLQLTFWETIFNGSVILFKSIWKLTMINIYQLLPNVTERQWWTYWTESDFELEFKNLLAESSLMVLAINGIIEAICVAVNSGATNIVQQDIFRINTMLIDIYEALETLGKLVPKKTAKLRDRGDYIEVYSELKAEHNRLQNVIKFEVSKYYEHISPYLVNISIPQKMLKQLHKIIEDTETSGVELD